MIPVMYPLFGYNRAPLSAKQDIMLNVILQTLLPHHLLSRIMLRLLRIRWGWLKNLQIRFVIWKFNVDMSQVENPDINSYEHFNAFFTRAMKNSARPIHEADNAGSYCSPVDGTISQLGHIEDGQLLQAKGIDYSLLELVGGHDEIAEQFNDGHFATIYLSPRDYHRIHMPATGRLVSMTYIPGRLFSVADSLVQNLPNLFNRNERVVCLFETEHGPLAIILVGAIFVGCMDTVWHGTVTPPHRAEIDHEEYAPERAPTLNKGDEMGRFNMGSTVIALWPAGKFNWNASLMPGSSITMGSALGSRP